MPRKARHPNDRFDEKVDVRPGGCWQWLGAIDHNGYSIFRGYHSRLTTGHTFSWRRFRGKVPEGMCLDHLCRNRGCVNPEHLRVVTQAENIMAGNGLAAINARKLFCVRGHALSGDNLRFNNSGRRLCRTCVNGARKRQRSKA